MKYENVITLYLSNFLLSIVLHKEFIANFDKIGIYKLELELMCYCFIHIFLILHKIITMSSSDFYFLFTATTPPNIPKNIDTIIIIIDARFNEKFPFNMLDIKYKNKIYIKPTIAPFNNPFFSIFLFPIVLPINKLTAVIIITTGDIVFS